MERQVAMREMRHAGVLSRQVVGFNACAERGCNH